MIVVGMKMYSTCNTCKKHKHYDTHMFMCKCVENINVNYHSTCYGLSHICCVLHVISLFRI